MNSYIYNITGEDITSTPEFLLGLAKTIVKTPNTQCLIMDAANALGGSPITEETIKYGSGECKEIVAKIIEICNAKKTNNTPDEVVCMIVGINSLFQKMTPIEKGNLTMAIQNSSGLGTVRFIIVETIGKILTKAGGLYE